MELNDRISKIEETLSTLNNHMIAMQNIQN